jgi:hypothetical protein
VISEESKNEKYKMDWKRNRFGEIEEWKHGLPLEKGDDIWFEWSCHIVYKKKRTKKKYDIRKE